MEYGSKVQLFILIFFFSLCDRNDFSFFFSLNFYTNKQFSNKDTLYCFFIFCVHTHAGRQLIAMQYPITTINSFRKLIVSFCIFFVPFLSFSVYFYRHNVVEIQLNWLFDSLPPGLDVASFQLLRYISYRYIFIDGCFFLFRTDSLRCTRLLSADALYRFHFGSVIVHSIHFLYYRNALSSTLVESYVFRVECDERANDKI